MRAPVPSGLLTIAGAAGEALMVLDLSTGAVTFSDKVRAPVEAAERFAAALRVMLGGLPAGIDPDRLTAAVADHQWEDGRPWSIHSRHQYDGGCLICRGDVGAIVRAVIEHATQAADG